MQSAVDANRAWIARAIAKLDEDRLLEIDTPLLKLDLPELSACKIYIKDETTHPTGSLKHRLARSLFLHAICNGDIREGTTVVEASSGSTAISEAYFANLLALPFIAVLPRGTATAKRDAIARAGAQIHLVDPPDEISTVAAGIARERHGHFMDQFTFAERATDWRGNNNIAESLFAQMAQEIHPVPAWIVVGAGPGRAFADRALPGPHQPLRRDQHPVAGEQVEPPLRPLAAHATISPAPTTARQTKASGALPITAA